jgi:hypothetical protein
MTCLVRLRHPELVSGSIMETALPVQKWMLKQVQHDGEPDA